jgi:SAM-dependent methyltransferase
VVRPTDVVYPGKVRVESRYWERYRPEEAPLPVAATDDRQVNAAYTGNPDRRWIDDLVARGPFGRAAALGCDAGEVRAWLASDGSERLDVYELSPGVIRQTGARLGALRPRARFHPADLNFARLPAAHYDVIWSRGCLHHVVNLEHLLAEVERALRPGGLFAFVDYVGERRMQFDVARLARANAALREVPARWRRTDVVAPPRREALSPFCAVRSDDILPLVRQRFERVHEAATGALFPLRVCVDTAALEREAPEVAARLRAAEDAASHAPDARPCEVYAVYRRR